ncbi:MAG: LysR family transcriptional regulator [Candidatus Caenarcaniphilales bacterium]|nr:LysR family transcriptional regulator [Candidatus Caenarcaniphilales bacterium]
MDLRHIKYFKTVADEKSFSKAAEKLFVAQPAISQQIAFLEKEVGAQLLHRSKKQVSLTITGKVFYKEVKGILEQAQIALLETKRAAKGEIGSINIAFICSPVLHFLPDLIKKFREQNPNVRVSLMEMNPDKQIKAFEEQRIDISFSRPIDKKIHMNLNSYRVYKDFFYAAIPESHYLAEKKRVNPKDLLDENLILFSKEIAAKQYNSCLTLFDGLELDSHRISEAFEMQSILTMVEAECGIGIVPGCVQNLSHRNICFKKIGGNKEVIYLDMIWSKDNTNPLLESIMDIVKTKDLSWKLV